MSTENNSELLFKNSVKILTDLISFKTISGEDNNSLIDYCDDILKKIGASSFRTFDDVKSKFYNKPIKINNKVSHEKLYRNDKKYDLLIPIEYNSKKPKKNKGSAIFIHLTSNYKKTQGCIAIKEKDMLILLKLINKKTKIKII